MLSCKVEWFVGKRTVCMAFSYLLLIGNNERASREVFPKQPKPALFRLFEEVLKPARREFRLLSTEASLDCQRLDR